MVKLFLPKLLRTKVEALLDRDIPELRRPLKSGRKARYIEEKLEEIDAAIEKRASKEEMDEFEAILKADEALADLEAALVKLEKEEKEAKEVRRLEDEWEKRRMEERIRISPEELKVHEAALDEYAKKLGSAG